VSSLDRQEKLRRIWEPTYTVVYRELKDEAGAAPTTPAATATGDSMRRLMEDELYLPNR